MLDSRNFLFCAPDTEVDVVEITPRDSDAEWFKDSIKYDAKCMSNRPEKVIDRTDLEAKISKLEKENKDLKDKLEAIEIFGT
jgi:hypothetical protein